MADTYKHTWKSSLTAESETLVNKDRVFVADGHVKLNPTIPASSVDFAVTVAFKKDDVLSYRIAAPGPLTIKTNVALTPQETVDVDADAPLEWDAGMDPALMHFSGDVTGFFVTNGATAAIDMSIRVLVDTTPST